MTFKFFDWLYVAASGALVAFFGWSCWKQPTFDTLSTILFGSMIVGALIGIRSSVKTWTNKVAELKRTLAELESFDSSFRSGGDGAAPGSRSRADSELPAPVGRCPQPALRASGTLTGQASAASDNP